MPLDAKKLEALFVKKRNCGNAAKNSYSIPPTTDESEHR